MRLLPPQAQMLQSHIPTISAVTGCMIGIRAASSGGGQQVFELVATGTPPQLQSVSMMTMRLMQTAQT
jgi:hypothetical protein